MTSKRRHGAAVWLACSMVVVACGGETTNQPTASTQTPGPSDRAVAAVVTDAAMVAPIEPTPAAKPPPARFPMPSGSPSSWGDYCAKNQECNWDGACFPSACVGVNKVVASECEESGPPPGNCACVADQCTLVPANKTRPESPNWGCTSDKQCAVDAARAICHVVANPDGQRLQGPLDVEGPFCTCDAKRGRCDYHYAEPVPCKSFRECSWEREPRLRPVPAAKPRKKPVRPCKDGALDSVCKERDGAKMCHIVAWRC